MSEGRRGTILGAVLLFLAGGFTGFAIAAGWIGQATSEHLTEIKSLTTHTRDQIKQLQSTMRRFHSENWQIVMPDAQADARALTGAIGNLEGAVNNAEIKLTR